MLTEKTYATAYEGGLRSTIRLLLSKGLMAQDAEEWAQAAWVRGWEARHQLKEDERVVPWINRIAVNTMCNEIRRSKRQVALDDTDSRPVCQLPVAAQVDARKMLAHCSKLDRSLMVHRYAGGFKMEEIAALHGLTGVATRVRIHRAKAALRRFASQTPLPAAA